MNKKPCAANEVVIDEQAPRITPVIDLEGLAAHFGVSISTIQRMVADDEFPKPFPKPIKFGRRVLRWRVDEINAWIESQ